MIEKYGSKKSKRNTILNLMSANPTGPMHIGHCEGAVFGDVLANLLEFHGNKVNKEYYVNDYGNQIKNFTRSVYLRIEIKYKEKFIIEPDLYPGDYIRTLQKKLNEDPK